MGKPSQLAVARVSGKLASFYPDSSRWVNQVHLHPLFQGSPNHFILRFGIRPVDACFSAFTISIFNLVRNVVIWSTALKTRLSCAHAAFEGAQYVIESLSGVHTRNQHSNIMKTLKRRNRLYDTSRFGQPEIRVRHRGAVGKKSPCYVLRCGCCSESITVYHSEDGLEIGGVNGAIEDWREILLPLLARPRSRKLTRHHDRT